MQEDRSGLSKRYKMIRQVLLVVLGGDLLLASSKGFYGHLTDSLGMLSDGFHSAVHALGGVNQPDWHEAGCPAAGRAPSPRPASPSPESRARFYNDRMSPG